MDALAEYIGGAPALTLLDMTDNLLKVAVKQQLEAAVSERVAKGLQPLRVLWTSADFVAFLDEGGS